MQKKSLKNLNAQSRDNKSLCLIIIFISKKLEIHSTVQYYNLVKIKQSESRPFIEEIKKKEILMFDVSEFMIEFLCLCFTIIAF